MTTIQIAVIVLAVISGALVGYILTMRYMLRLRIATMTQAGGVADGRSTPIPPGHVPPNRIHQPGRDR